MFGLLALAFCLNVPVNANLGSPQADPACIVRCNTVTRFSVLTPRVVRFEYSAKAEFIDKASLFAVNRKLPVPKLSIHNATDWCNITIVADDGSQSEISFYKLSTEVEEDVSLSNSSCATPHVCNNTLR
jgi:hypothetical protein